MESRCLRECNAGNAAKSCQSCGSPRVVVVRRQAACALKAHTWELVIPPISIPSSKFAAPRVSVGAACRCRPPRVTVANEQQDRRRNEDRRAGGDHDPEHHGHGTAGPPQIAIGSRARNAVTEV
jgi:hypothetical protein